MRGSADRSPAWPGADVAGLRVDCRVDGEPRDLPPAVDVSAYRVLQEALTNVMKHARASTVEVDVRYLPDGLELEVTDDGPGGAPTSPDGGRGLVGMRERVRVLGGSVVTEPRGSAQGFRVLARLPA